MPTVTIVPVTAFAHCPLPVCPGAAQAEVAGEVVETSYTFFEDGGDIPGVERSVLEYRFADVADAPCVKCGRHREISGQPRPSYQPLSGFDQMGLLNAPAFDPHKVNTPEDAKVAALEAKLAALTAKIEGLVDARSGGEGT